jgi:hypothetical protein
LDDFEQELADIDRVERTISDLAFDGHQPGNLKLIVTPPCKFGRFSSPKQNRFETAPPKDAARPGPLKEAPALLTSTSHRGNDDFSSFSAIKLGPLPVHLVQPRSTTPSSAAKNRSAFFPTRLAPTQGSLQGV